MRGRREQLIEAAQTRPLEPDTAIATTLAQVREFEDRSLEAIGALTVEMVPVKSSHMARIGYHTPTLHLYIEFHDGALWRFPDIQEMTHRLLMAAPSKGAFFRAHIQPKFKGTELRAGVKKGKANGDQ